MRLRLGPHPTGPIREVQTVYDTDCPASSGPFHFWEVDGPNTVTCGACGADGVIVQTTEPETVEED